jgi:hypothetical protein
MIEPAPNNPATWRRIKAGATAQQLGWPEDRLARICRDHGYEYRPPVTAVVVAQPDAPPMSAAQANPEVRVKRRVQRSLVPRGQAKEARERLATLQSEPRIYPNGPPIWNYQTGEFTCGSVTVNIGGKQQSRLLSRLFNMYHLDPIMGADGEDIAEMIATSSAGVRSICWSLSSRLAPTGWRVEPVKGWRGSYRLARCER